MNEALERRLSKQLGLSDLTALCADNLPGSDLHSLLLAILKRRVSRLAPANLTEPSPVTGARALDGRVLNALERMWHETVSDYQAVELSPLCPLGAVRLGDSEAVTTGQSWTEVVRVLRGEEAKWKGTPSR